MRVEGGSPSFPTSTKYVEAQPGEALHLGLGGPAVSDLQQQLNALGARPPLAVDGKFGPKTQAALQKLLGTSTFDEAAQQRLAQLRAAPPPAADDFQPPPSGPRPGATPAATPTPVAAPSDAPPGSTAQSILDHANAENDSINPMKRGDDGHYKGWQQLQTVFEQTTGWRPSDAECQRIESGKGVQPGGKSWCGIWACHVLQEAGVNVKWDLTRGQMVGDVSHVMAPRFSTPGQYKAERSAFEQSIKPGDVITVSGKNNHHAIVTRVNPDGTVETMDGNKPYVGPGHQKLSDVTSYYRPS